MQIKPSLPLFSSMKDTLIPGAAYSPTVCRLWAGHGERSVSPGHVGSGWELDNTEVTMSGHVCPALCQSSGSSPSPPLWQSPPSLSRSLPAWAWHSQPPGHWGKPSLTIACPVWAASVPRLGGNLWSGGGGGRHEIYVSSAFSSATSKWKSSLNSQGIKQQCSDFTRRHSPSLQKGLTTKEVIKASNCHQLWAGGSKDQDQ